jgi:biotin-(acetyl-CoA carboxylase) ligase
MRSVAFLTAAVLAIGINQASAQPRLHTIAASMAAHAASYDDLGCAARYTLAAFVIRDLDSSAAGYYAQQAADAGKRYLAMHPGESEQAYSSRVVATEQNLQQRLATNAITPESLVTDIKSCDRNSGSLSVI